MKFRYFALVSALAGGTLLAQDGVARRRADEAPIKVVLVGDSTVAAEGGWGPAFCAALTANVACVDTAKNGRSSKSFVAEGLWGKALEEKGQYYFIQFGHNDGKPDLVRRTDPETAFAANLRRYLSDARAIGAVPILVSPLSRRNYVDGKLHIDDLKEYATAMRRVAAEEKVTFIDLYGMSTHLLEGMTQEEADTFDAIAHPDAAAENAGPAKPDRTHLNDKGKAVFGRMVVDEVVRQRAELRPDVKSFAGGAGASQ